VKATSTADTSKSGTATVTVYNSDAEIPATVTGVTVSPASATVPKGQSRQFSAVVEGVNLQAGDKTVT